MRPLSLTLEDKLKIGIRQPAYKVYAYDTTVDSISDIVTGKNTQPPLDLTDMVEGDLQWTPGQLSFTLADKDGSFHGDSGELRRYINDGCVIRLREGDARVAEDFWVWTFTGMIKGQSGWVLGPRSKMIVCKVTAYNRENTQSFNRRKITTNEYTDGTDIGIMLHDVAQIFMGLSDDEILIPYNTGRVFMHKINQLCLVAPWDGLLTISEVISRVPFFNGDGKLSWWSKNLSRNPDRVLPNYIKVFRLEMPARTQDVINKVKVTFLDSVMDEIESPLQSLGKAEVTTGFFTYQEKLPCWWSDDRRQRAKNTWMLTLKSVNDNLLPVGSESYQQNDEFHGTVTIKISVWVPILATVMVAEYLAASFIPDKTAPGQAVQVGPSGTGATVAPWFTIPWGKVLQAQASIAIMMIMMSLGSAQYEIWGTPYDFAYCEKRSIAVQEGLKYWEENQEEIKNDFIGSFDQADAVAVTELIFQKSMGSPRILVINDDLTLEKGDIVQIPDGRQIFIMDMKKTIKRGQVSQLEIDGFKVLAA
ncbi:MAG: hypothetical protein M1438_20310 [Deltaproteobacteria bacterium]|nr:hypothetical protein [Deltaproteobacteria bacterium]